MSEDNMMTDSSNSDKEINSSASSSMSGGASVTAAAVAAVVANNGVATAVPANGLVAPNGQATPIASAAGVAIKDDLIDEENDEDDVFDDDKEARGGGVVGTPGGCGSGAGPGQDEGGANAGVDVERLRAFNVSSHSLTTIHSLNVCVLFRCLCDYLWTRTWIAKFQFQDNQRRKSRPSLTLAPDNFQSFPPKPGNAFKST